MAEKSLSAYECAGRLLARRYKCCSCGDMRRRAIEKLNDGPEAVIRAFAEYDGMVCSAVEWARFYAQDWLDAQSAPTEGAASD